MSMENKIRISRSPEDAFIIQVYDSLRSEYVTAGRGDDLLPALDKAAATLDRSYLNCGAHPEYAQRRADCREGIAAIENLKRRAVEEGLHWKDTRHSYSFISNME